MKGTITKLVSYDYEGAEKRTRIFEQFDLIKSSGAKVQNVKYAFGFIGYYYQITGIFKRKK